MLSWVRDRNMRISRMEVMGNPPCTEEQNMHMKRPKYEGCTQCFEGTTRSTPVNSAAIGTRKTKAELHIEPIRQMWHRSAQSKPELTDP